MAAIGAASTAARGGEEVATNCSRPYLFSSPYICSPGSAIFRICRLGRIPADVRAEPEHASARPCTIASSPPP